MENQKFLTKKEAAQYLSDVLGLPTSEKTLSKYITCGGGPTFQKFGRRVVYTTNELLIWVKSKLSNPINNSSQI